MSVRRHFHRNFTSIVMASILVLGLVACARFPDVSTSNSVVDNVPLLPLPVDIEALRNLLLRMRKSPPYASVNKHQSHEHLAVSRANSFDRISEADARGWLSLLVRFSTPVHSGTLAALAEAADGAVTAAMGSGVFAVSCKSDALDRIRSFPGVSSVRLRSPADKLAALSRSKLHAARVPNLTDTDRIHIHSRCISPSLTCAAQILSVLEIHGCVVSCSQAPHYKAMGVCPALNAKAASAAVAELHEVDWVEEILPFVSHDFTCNNVLWSQAESNATFAAPLNGSGQVIAIADTGLDVSNCFFRYGQAITSANANSRIDAGNLHTYWTMDSCQQCGSCPRACSDFFDLEGHGTHVAGIAAGRANIALPGGSVAASENGLAYGASLFFQDISASVGLITPPIHLQQLFAPAYAAGARVHSNSWGCSGTKPTDCNSYSLSAREVDSFMFDHPDFLVVFAAGNAGSVDSVIGTVGSPATCKNCLSVGSSNIEISGAARNWQYTNALEMCQPRNGDINPSRLSPCCSASVGSVPGSECSLLELSCCPWDDEMVCCSEEAHAANHPAKSKLSSLTLSQFSSVGPTSDGRFKPDVVAPGHMIASANAHDAFGPSSAAHCTPPPSASATNVKWNERAVRLMSGTSMAAPAIAAVAAIVRQWFQEGWYPSGIPDSHASINPSSALVRAVIAASAVSLNSGAASNGRPSVKSGFGLPSLARALYIKSTGGSERIAVVDASSIPHAGSASVRHGSHNVVTAACSGGKVSVALAWNDPPGHPSASLQLVNDLDLLVWSKVAQDSQPVLIFGNGGSIADSRNNLETVSTSCVVGSNITVAVVGAVVLSPLQFYALVLSGAIDQSTLAATNASKTMVQAAAAGRSVQGLGPRAYPSNAPCAAGLESSRPILASFLFKNANRPPEGTCSDQDISLALANVLRVSMLACSVYGRGDSIVQVRFACDVSIGVDFFLAETRAIETLNFLLALAQQARSQTAATGAKLELESGCLRYFEWGSVAVVTTSPNAAPQRSSAITTQPLLMLLILTSISTAVFN